MRHVILVIMIIAFFVNACACGDDESSGRADFGDDDTSSDDDDDDDESGGWGQCPNYIGGFFECMKFETPMDYDDPEGEKIEVFAYRRLALRESKGQIWFLEGGPGGSGASFTYFFQQLFAGRYPNWDLYSLDHRGVGNSTRLGCPQEWDNVFDIGKCVDSLQNQWGDDVKHFSATNAARDLGLLIDETKEEGKTVYVYGVSYGTYWLQRYLQILPNQADGVIMDSLAMPTVCYLDNYDYLFNEVGKQIMAVCGVDPICSAKLGGIADTPWDAVGAVFERIDNGDLCGAFSDFDHATLRQTLGFMEMDWFARVLIPPLIYRLNRCSDADVRAVEYFLAALFGAYREAKADDWVDSGELFSGILALEVALSEMWGDKNYDQVMSIVSESRFSVDAAPFYAQVNDSHLWPTYEDDGYFEKWADTDIPILMLNGTLDPQTPLEIAAPAADQFNAAHQQFVSVPYSPHCVMASSWTEDAIFDGSATCGEKIMFDFFDDPTGEIDLQCLAEVYPLEFDPTSDVSELISDFYFATSDMWEGNPSGAKRSNADDRVRKIMKNSLINSIRRNIY